MFDYVRNYKICVNNCVLNVFYSVYTYVVKLVQKKKMFQKKKKKEINSWLLIIN